MKSLIQWAINNSPAMNTMMIASLIVGAACLVAMRREVFPEFELEIVLVTVPYPGASPEEVEEGICQKIEEACQAISGIKKQTSVAQEGAGFMILELEAGSNTQKILAEVRSEIDQIPSFPELSEDPDIKQITFRMPSIQVGVIGPKTDDPDAERQLREIAEQVRDELLQQPPSKPKNWIKRALSMMTTDQNRSGISSANLVAAKNYQIDVEISEDTLRRHGLTLQQVAQIIRQENLELPGGNLKTSSQEVRLRGKNKRQTGLEIEKIQILTNPNGDVLSVGDLGTVQDGFADTTAIHEIDGEPGLVVTVERTSNEDLFTVVNTALEYVENKQMPPGYRLVTWGDQSIDVRDRMDMLTRNGIQGLILVFLVLAIFLNLRLAFWVALGIPISILGAGYVLMLMDQTLNMLSMFAFLMALGIVVDDAIVIGENIFEHRKMGKKYVQAAIDGTFEVLPSVIASVTTTIIAFAPLLFVAGIMGKFIAVMPVAVIAMLVISLIESAFILPCHLAHENKQFFRVVSIVLFPIRSVGKLFERINRGAAWLMDWAVERFYAPLLRWSIQHKAMVLSIALAFILLSAGVVQSGVTPFVLFPKMDSREIKATIIYPDGTPSYFADEGTKRLEQAIYKINEEVAKQSRPFIAAVHRSVGQVTADDALGPEGVTDGSHAGSVNVSLTPTEERSVTSQQLLKQWREVAGQFPGAEIIKFSDVSMGPGGKAIEFKLLADKEHMDQLNLVVEKCKAKLQTYNGVFDIEDDARPGKWELQIRIKEEARAMGVKLQEVAQTVRASFYGEEVMRLQRGRHEVKLMVRYPTEERRSLQDFENLRIRTSDGAERPVTELAHIEFRRGTSEINRLDQLRSVTITADIDEAVATANDITNQMQKDFLPPLLNQFPNVRVRWEGQKQQSTESVQSMMVGTVIALMVMFVVLTIEFRSYLQPLIIMCTIPFGIVGAVFGHAVMGLEVTLFSFFGLVALTGVVVNDSIVLVDFVNKRLANGLSLNDAVVEAGKRRFRPVWLTSLTTVAGLIPMLLETSFQAQILIPMATSLCFGLLFATMFILVLVPVYYSIYGSLFLRSLRKPSETDEDRFDETPTATPQPVETPDVPQPHPEVVLEPSSLSHEQAAELLRRSRPAIE